MSEDKLMRFLAIDLGASSGRAMLGSVKNDRLQLQEISRFANPIVETNGRLYWDLLHLYNQIIQSLKEIKSRGIHIASVGIDTWGVDFVCFGADGEPLRMPYSYRDTHTFGAPERFFERVPKKEVYAKTGIQIMNFNSLFQLATQREESAVYPLIHKIAFMPDALAYLLTGKMVTEYTIASTSQMLNPYEKDLEASLLAAVGLDRERFAPMVFSGTEIGNISPSVQKQTGFQHVSVVAVAGHDTASAVLAVPAKDRNFAYLSSGTWSLMGIESEKPVITDETFALNFTNEGGADGSIRLLKNICGMWLIEQCKKEWEKGGALSYADIVREAEQAPAFQTFINPDSPCFASPASMTDAIAAYCRQTHQKTPQTVGETARCIYESLAFRYKQTLENLRKLSPHSIDTLHIIGGGSQNRLLNQYTANATALPVVAGPSEATAIGNILLQAKAAGLVKNTDEMRAIVRNSVELETFEPKAASGWEENYRKYLDVYKII